MTKEKKEDLGGDERPQRSGEPSLVGESQLSHVVRLSTRISGYTLLGGVDNPNCFSLGSVRIVNMTMGPFERVVGNLGATDVEVTLLGPRTGVITDSRFPEHELRNSRWCTCCCPFRLLPEAQQRAHLRTWTPHIADGRVSSWSGGVGRSNNDEAIERLLATLRSIGAA